MYFELKENKPHGTKDDPFSTYHIKNEGRSFQIPAHWHDELEIIYVKSGFLTVSISGENYIGTPGDAFVVSPGNLHFMGSQTGTVDYWAPNNCSDKDKNNSFTIYSSHVGEWIYNRK